MKKQKQLDRWDVIGIIDEERKKRRENFWQLFFVYTFIIILSAFAILLLWFAFNMLVDEINTQRYENFCEMKLSGILYGNVYSLEACFVFDEEDFINCECFYYTNQTFSSSTLNVMDKTKFNIPKGELK